jgi:hypothetical protein
MPAAPLDNLTPAEAAVVAGVTLRDVHRMIDEHILPERFSIPPTHILYEPGVRLHFLLHRVR